MCKKSFLADLLEMFANKTQADAQAFENFFTSSLMGLPDSKFMAGIIHLEGGRFARAAECFHSTKESNISSHIVNLFRVYALLNIHRTAQALDFIYPVYPEQKTLAATKMVAHLLAVMVYRDQGAPAMALDVAKQFVNPDGPSGFELLVGKIHLIFGDISGAQEYMGNPGDSKARLLRFEARQLWQMKRQSAAAAKAEEAIRCDFSDHEMHALLGMVYARQDRQENALISYLTSCVLKNVLG